MYFLHKRPFGLISNQFTFILYILPTAFCTYIVPTFLKSKIKMGQNLWHDGKICFNSKFLLNM